MSFNKKFFATGGIVASSADAVCTTDSVDPFGDSSGVALYSLDYDASEASGTYDGTPTNVEFGVGGKINYGARFNGSSSRINTGYQIPSGLSGFSVSAWVKAASVKTQFIVGDLGEDGASADGMFQINISSANVLRAAVGGVASQTIATLSNYIDTWTHIVVTTDSSGNIIGYVNGSQVGTASGNSLAANTKDFIIGMFGDTSHSSTFNGDIDQVRLFSKALNQSEVDTLYNSGNGEIPCVYTATTTDNYYPLADGSSDAVAYYKLDNSSEDYVGSNDGTDTNVEYRFGRYGQAAVFNGSSSYINTTIPASVFNTDTWSISLWIKHTDTDFGYFAGTTSGITVGNGMGIALYGDGTRFDFVFRNGTTTVSRFQGGTLAINTWSNIVIVSDNNSVSFYQDSSLMSAYSPTQFNQNPLNVSSFAHSQPLYIGRTGTNTNDTWGGKIDQVRIYSTALSSSQVTELYNEKPEVDTSNFKTVLYEGTGATQYISNVGFDLDVDDGGDGGLVWIKRRNTSADHYLVDSVRGNGSSTYKNLSSNTTNAEGTTTSSGITNDAFEANGFIMQGSGARTNANGSDYVAWVWKAGGDAVLNEVGDIDSQVSANTAAGFSIVKFDGYQSSGTTCGHGLSSAPELIIAKNLNQTTSWPVWYDDAITTTSTTFMLEGSTKYLALNSTTGYIPYTFDRQFGGTLSGSSGDKMIAYCFHSVAGYSKIGTYLGDGTTSGNIVYTTDDGLPTGSNGFEPSFLMIKRVTNSSTGGDWVIYDNRRDTTNPNTAVLAANQNFNEAAFSSGYDIDFLSNGFELKASGYAINNSETYLYMAFK